MSKKFEESTKQNAEIKELLKEHADLARKNQNLEIKVKELQNKINKIEQRSRLNNLEIHGVPVTTNEDPMKIVLSVANLMKAEIKREDVDICHRLPKKPHIEHPGLIVYFKHQSARNEFLSAKKNTVLYTNNLELPQKLPPHRIYISENLTAYNRKIYNLARKAKLQNSYKYIWIKDGVTYLRKADWSKTICVRYENDLSKVV